MALQIGIKQVFSDSNSVLMVPNVPFETLANAEIELF